MIFFKEIFTSSMLGISAFICLSNADLHMDVEERSFSISVTAMMKLLNSERFLIDIIGEEIFNLKKNLDIIQRFLENLHIEHKKPKYDPESYLANPLNAFSLIRRTHFDWFKVWQKIHLPTESAMRRNEFYFIHFPTRRDLLEAAAGIEGIQETYNLSLIDIAKGRINSKQYNLSAFNVFVIGNELFKLEKYKEAFIWLNASLFVNNTSFLSKEIFEFDQAKAEVVLAEVRLRLGV